MSPDRLRSYLYAPGDAPQVMEKALRSVADAVILDLEDAVPLGARRAARDSVVEAIASGAQGPQIHVRINVGPDGYDREDLRAVVRPGLDAIRLPKAHDPNHIRAAAALIEDLERDRGMPDGRVALYPTIESARGLLAMAQLGAASARIARFAFGSSDYLADIAATDAAAEYARNVMVVQSRAARVGAPVDSVYTRRDDLDGLRVEVEGARQLGMFGKSVIHPRQIEVVHQAFTPDAETVAAAQAIVEAWEHSRAQGRNAIQAEGQFIDPAVVARARATLELDRKART